MSASRRQSQGSSTQQRVAASRSASQVLFGPWDNSVNLNDALQLVSQEFSRQRDQDGATTILAWQLTLLLFPRGLWGLLARSAKISGYDGEDGSKTPSTSTQGTKSAFSKHDGRQDSHETK